VAISTLANSNAGSTGAISTRDQLLYSALHGTAMRYAAERRNLDESIEELRQIADDRNDILAEAAGITAGSWYASPAAHVGYELIGAGMLILAGGGRGLPMDYDELERWTRFGYERGMPARKG
jgi:enoyl reductase-like protein